MSGKTPRKNPINSFLDVVSVCLVLISLVALCFVVTKPYRSKAEPEPAKTAVDGQKRYITKNIEDIRIGERTLGTNPQGRLDSELDESVFQILPHCGFSLRYTSEDGSRCDIRLLRPADWLDWEPTRLCRTSDGQAVDAIDLVSEDLASGGFDVLPDYELETWIDLPEMGVVGWARVTDVDADVEIESGAGNIVTGVFAHTASSTLDLTVEGQTAPIGCTANHPFWSVDRQDFVTAGELREGERLALYSGETKRVVQKLPRPGPEVVYNLEVYGEHAYCVSPYGVLVHNCCEHVPAPTKAEINNKFGKNRRPYIRKNTKDAIWEAYYAQKEKALKKDKPFEEVLDPVFGHKKGVEFWRLKRLAYDNGLTRAQFNDLNNFPQLYEIQENVANASHRFEDLSKYDERELIATLRRLGISRKELRNLGIGKK